MNNTELIDKWIEQACRIIWVSATDPLFEITLTGKESKIHKLLQHCWFNQAETRMNIHEFEITVSLQAHKTPEIFCDNHRVPLNPYAVFPRIGTYKFESSRALHFDSIWMGNKKKLSEIFLLCLLSPLLWMYIIYGPSCTPTQFKKFRMKILMSNEVAKYCTKKRAENKSQVTLQVLRKIFLKF